MMELLKLFAELLDCVAFAVSVLVCVRYFAPDDMPLYVQVCLWYSVASVLWGLAKRGK